MWRMPKVIKSVKSPTRVTSPGMRALVENLHYEIVPMKSIDQAILDLPPHANVSVTCSPAKGIATTQDFTVRLLELGHHPIPHFAARLVEGPDHVVELAAWLRKFEIREVFVIAGDAPEPAGPYEGALPFMRALLAENPGVQRMGFSAYPEGHALMEQHVVDAQLHAKQALLEEFGVAGWASTQMCFDEAKIRTWLVGERAKGFALPVRLGVPGVVDRARLLSMSTRLGIGASLRFLSKNKSTVMKLLSPGGYDPTDMVVAFAHDADALGIEALHSFTFNAVADTKAWRDALVGGGQNG